MKLLLLTLAAGAAIAGAACAQPRPADRGACFFRRDIANHTIADGRTMYLNVRGNQTYAIGMRRNCLSGAMSSDPIVIHNATQTMQICRPSDLDIGVRGGRCIVDSVRRLTPAEVDAIPPRLRP